MAQRRVNVRFVGIALVVIVGLIGSLAFAKFFLLKKDPQRYVKTGADAYELYKKNHDIAALLDAMNNYKAACDLMLKDTKPAAMNVRVTYGDVLHDLGRVDPTYMGQDRQVWGSVLQVDPVNKEALKRLLTWNIELIEFNPSPPPTVFGQLSDVAEKLLKVIPQNADGEDAELRATAQAYLHIAVIAGWLTNVATDEVRIHDNMDALARQLEGEKSAADAAVARKEKRPINADVPYFLARGYVKQAHELLIGAGQSKSDKEDAAKLEKQAYSVFDTLVIKYPDPVLSLRFYMVLRSISDVLENDMAQDRPDYKMRMQEVLENARWAVEPTDRAYTEVYLYYADFLARNKLTNDDGEDAESVLRYLLKKRPDDQSARRALAAMLHLSPKTRTEAIELLRKPITDQGDLGAITYRNRPQLEADTYADLTNYLVEAYASSTNPAERDQLSKQIDESYQKLVERTGVSVRTLKLKGKITLSKGGVNAAIDAIPELERARELYLTVSGANARKDADYWDLQFLLATAYVDSQQTGQARQRLAEIVAGVPNFAPARILLARLQIRAHDLDGPDGARAQVEWLKRIAPNDPEVHRLELAMEITNPNKLTAKDIDEVLAKMPERSLEEIRSKAQVAVAAQNYDEAIRLLEKIRADHPFDVDTVRTLVQFYMSPRINKKDLAIKVAEEAIRAADEAMKNPAPAPDKTPTTDPAAAKLAADTAKALPQIHLSLQIVRAQIDGDKDKIIELTKKGIDSIKDPGTREMSYYEFYTAHGEKDEALKHLIAAEKVATDGSPEMGRILDTRFGLALMASKWDEAEKYAERLGLINYDEANGMIYRYRLALVRGDLKGAENQAKELVKNKPEFARSWLCYGDVLKEQQQYEEAINKYSMALQNQSENLEAFRGLIECSYLLNKKDDAWQYIQKGLKVNPNDPYLREQEMAYQMSFGDAEKAVQKRQELATLNPDKVGPQVAYGAAEWQVAQQAAQKNKPDEYKAHTEKARRIFTSVTTRWPDDRLAYAYLADIATATNDFANGEKALKELAAREKWKDSPDPQLLLGDYYFRFGKFDEAEKAYNDALTKAPSIKDVAAVNDMRRKVATFFTSRKKYDKALEVLEPGKGDRKVQQQILDNLLASGELTKAGQKLDELLAANPNDALFLASKAYLKLQEKNPQEAMALLDKAIAIDPRNQMALFYRGTIKLRLGKEAAIDDAIKDLTTARDVVDEAHGTGTTNAQLQMQTRLALSDAYRARGQTDAAIQEVEMCLVKQPGNREVRLKLIEMLATLAVPRWAQVDQLVEDALKMKDFAGDPVWYRVRAMEWQARKNPEKALEAIRMALQLSRAQPDHTLPLMQDYLNILASAKQYDTLKSECDGLLAKPDMAMDAWWVYRLRGVALAKLNQNEAALNDFDKALEIVGRIRRGPADDDMLMVIIQTIGETVGRKPAIERCKQRIEKAENGNHWRVLLAYMYFAESDFKNAEATIEQALQNAGTLTRAEQEEAYGVAGSIYMLAGSYEKAADAYTKLLEIKPEDSVSLNNLACVYADYLKTPDPAKALTYSTKALEVAQKVGGPLDPNVMDTHGWVLVCNDRLDEGIDYLRQAINQLDRKPLMETHYHLGMALLKKKFGPEAQMQLNLAFTQMKERENKGQPVDKLIKDRLTAGLLEAKRLMAGGESATSDGGNGSAATADKAATTSTGTTETTKP
jgi:tetratricopeptide (TPR) repeat protein